ncbi:hypothetical protein BH11PLA2_BH11PLA2_12520 [soil metagenome]
MSESEEHKNDPAMNNAHEPGRQTAYHKLFHWLEKFGGPGFLAVLVGGVVYGFWQVASKYGEITKTIENNAMKAKQDVDLTEQKFKTDAVAYDKKQSESLLVIEKKIGDSESKVEKLISELKGDLKQNKSDIASLLVKSQAKLESNISSLREATEVYRAAANTLARM